MNVFNENHKGVIVDEWVNNATRQYGMLIFDNPREYEHWIRRAMYISFESDNPTQQLADELQNYLASSWEEAEEMAQILHAPVLKVRFDEIADKLLDNVEDSCKVFLV
jgi:hypothetical protein